MKRWLVAVLALLCTQACCVSGVEVEQSPPAQSLQEGATSMLQCNFSTSVNSVQWINGQVLGALVLILWLQLSWVSGQQKEKSEQSECSIIEGSCGARFGIWRSNLPQTRVAGCLSNDDIAGFSWNPKETGNKVPAYVHCAPGSIDEEIMH
ncbi:T cell receptor alpha variable 22 [Manis javanica]|nr:T cell receptor alpha variable 22 [Manis javanica]